MDIHSAYYVLFSPVVLLISFQVAADVIWNPSRHLWTPSDNRTRDEWLACRGLPADSCERVHGKMQRLIDIEYGTNGRTKSGGDKVAYNTFDGCILLSEEHIDEIIARAEQEHFPENDPRGRAKRQLANFTAFPRLQWTTPIVYKFDGSHKTKVRKGLCILTDVTQQNIIRGAFQLWSDNTCLRFTEISTYSRYTDHHILVTKNGPSICQSYIGRVSFIPQPLFLGDDCLSILGIPGTPVHEIGHALGLYHEQQRSDRDGYLRINRANINESSYPANYQKTATVNVVPYHFGSVMHYEDTSFSINSSDPYVKTMLALNPLYQRNMGQRAEISFDDAHAINIAYNCDRLQCSGSPAITCQRGGYRDPNNCAMCKCPDGFGGTHCEKVADPVNAVCGGNIRLDDSAIQVNISSPGYEAGITYDNFVECSWLITAPQGFGIRLNFIGVFEILGTRNCIQSCSWHWVEVKYQRDLSLEGARFCCNNRSSVAMTSESNEMLVVFKSNFNYRQFLHGFKAVVTTMTIVNGGIGAFGASSFMTFAAFMAYYFVQFSFVRS